MKLHSIFFLLVLSVFLSCNGQASKIIKMTEATDFAKKINTIQNPQILDVRTPEEFTEGHIKDAANVNWLGERFVSDAEKFDKTKPIFVYCKSGNRSMKATEKLQQLGFKNIYELEGGFMKWRDANLTNVKE
jgi:rhodanese-related sulfurtransferase